MLSCGHVYLYYNQLLPSSFQPYYHHALLLMHLQFYMVYLDLFFQVFPFLCFHIPILNLVFSPLFLTYFTPFGFILYAITFPTTSLSRISEWGDSLPP